MVQQRWSGEGEEEFAALYAEHFGWLVRWTTAVFGRTHADDIAQEALVRLYQRPGMLHPGTGPRPWLTVVARNIGRDLLRQRVYRCPTDPDVLDRLPAGEDPADPVEREHDVQTVREALARLPTRQRNLLQLCDVEGGSHSDVAELLGIEPNTLRQRLFRARRRLAATFTLLDDPPPPGPDRRVTRRFVPPEVRPRPGTSGLHESCVCGRASCALR